MHDKGFIYWDLKLENVMIWADGHLTLVDFGFTYQTYHKHRASTVCGTPGYMAPEIMRKGDDDTSYGQPVDMWAFGIMLCDMIGGFTPFDSGSGSIMWIYENIIHGRMKLPRNLTHDQWDLISKLLDIDEWAWLDAK